MFEKYSYKTKCIALMVVFFMLCITAYKRSFKTLFEVIKEYTVLSSKIEDMNKKGNTTDQLLSDIASLDKIIGKENIAKEIIQQEIVSFATKRHPGVSINELQPIHIFSDENYSIVTNQLDITGNTNQLLQLGYDFEKSYHFSRIVSMNFYSINKNNKYDVLHLKIIFQNYENNK